MRTAYFPLALGALALALPFTRCSKPAPVEQVRLEASPLGSDLAESFSGDKAFAHVETLVGFGPRPPASEGFAKSLDYLEKTLAAQGWKTRRQTFRAATPDGPVDFTNLLARHGSAPAEPESLPILIGGHIDTKKMSFPFLGANDSGSSTGVMLEMARVLSGDPESAAKVEFLFFDGEEAFRPGISNTDGLYGSKYFAHELSTRPTWPAVGVVLDIVGDPNYPLLYNPEAPESFAKTIEECAVLQEFEQPFKMATLPIIDDHVPLQNTGLPCLHLIGDFSAMHYWHQKGDTLDKVTPEMLGKVGRMTFDFLSRLPSGPVDPATAE